MSNYIQLLLFELPELKRKMKNEIEKVINKRTGRKQRNFMQIEEEFQRVQELWAQDESNLEAWASMWKMINDAVFNCMNKALETKLPREVIEERSLDVTCNCMSAIRNKRRKGLEFRIQKLSSFVHNPCKARYKEAWKQEDREIPESVYFDGCTTIKDLLENEDE